MFKAKVKSQSKTKKHYKKYGLQLAVNNAKIGMIKDVITGQWQYPEDNKYKYFLIDYDGLAYASFMKYEDAIKFQLASGLRDVTYIADEYGEPY